MRDKFLNQRHCTFFFIAILDFLLLRYNILYVAPFLQPNCHSEVLLSKFVQTTAIAFSDVPTYCFYLGPP
jgi:hypothetical protein